MDVLVTGRHCQIPDEFRARVEEKITSIEKLKDRVIRVEVQVSVYGHKREPDQSTRVEITLRSKGPVVRAEASADDKTVAFDHALQVRAAFATASAPALAWTDTHLPYALAVVEYGSSSP